jgi:DNA-binding transcriptional regulator YhcF (GntR family)
MTLPKYQRVAASVRTRIAEGLLRPGQAAPSAAALARAHGVSPLTCRKALQTLIEEGTLTPGPSRNARPRVPASARTLSERSVADAERALSTSLAARRRAIGLTQPQFAAALGVSVTTVGHAETGRLWQARRRRRATQAARCPPSRDSGTPRRDRPGRVHEASRRFRDGLMRRDRVVRWCAHNAGPERTRIAATRDRTDRSQQDVPRWARRVRERPRFRG